MSREKSHWGRPKELDKHVTNKKLNFSPQKNQFIIYKKILISVLHDFLYGKPSDWLITYILYGKLNH